MVVAGKKVEEEGGGCKMIDIQMIDKDKKSGKVTFLLKNTNHESANSLRRVMMDSVPTMAIEDVEFRKNTSALYDEMVAHRLGLLPLKTDLKSYTLQEECKCEGVGCARCTLTFSLKAKGPGYVYASDLKPKDPKIKPLFPQTPIAKLIKGQEIELEATAILGKGKKHVKFSPCLAWYTYEPQVTVNNNSPKFEEFKDKYPPQVFDKNGKIDKKLILSEGLVDACEGVCEDIVAVEYNTNNFIFHIEPWGQLTASEIIQKATELLKETLTEFQEKI